MGDPNASIPTPQPVHYRPMFGAFGGRARDVGDVRVEGGPGHGRDRLARTREAAGGGARHANVKKADMVHNDWQPRIEVDPQTYEVRADGELMTCEPASVLPLAQRYFLF